MYMIGYLWFGDELYGLCAVFKDVGIFITVFIVSEYMKVVIY